MAKAKGQADRPSAKKEAGSRIKSGMTKEGGGRGGRRLKVFRTPIPPVLGVPPALLRASVHDAYVAASSQKAALAAWGSGGDLFAQGLAEVVTDPKLTREPLARPGEVIRKLRGTEAEQLRALGKKRVG